MKTFSITIVLFLLHAAVAHAQVVTADPPLPTAGQAVTIYFDATQGDQGLLDFTGDVYAHTGVLTDQSTSGTDWRYVKTDWGENTPETKLNRESENFYSLQITPSIREYYGVPQEEEITHLAFVFRSADKSRTGRDVNGADIFYQVYEEGLQVRIDLPAEYISIVDLDELLTLEATATLADTMALYLNGEFRKGVGPLNRITDTLPTNAYGAYHVRVWAANQEGEVTDSLFYQVRGEPEVEELPGGTLEGINYLSDTSVVLSLFAPGKEHVYAIGDFTGWIPGEEFFMKLTPDGEHFWIRIDGLEPGKIYRLYYLVDGNLPIPDPNTELLVDPAWDQYISESTFPGITELYQGIPEGQFAVIQTGREAYPWRITDFSPPEEQDLVIYELLVRDFLAAHDWQTLSDTLDYLEELGINAIELMPFNEFRGNENWGYEPAYWMCPDKYYGPPDDLKAFVDECHSRGMAVIQDIVFNHAAGCSPYAVMYRDDQGYPSAENPWLNEDFDLNDPNGWYQARHPYNVFFDFDHSSIYTQQLVDRSTRYWMEQYGIDGFRFDLTKGFTQHSTYLGTDGSGNARYDEAGAAAYDAQRIGFLKRMADSIWAAKENAYVILEHFCDNTEEKELSDYGMMIWGNSNHNYGEAVMGYNQSGNSDLSGISYQKRGWDDPHVVGYMESHDEERLMYKMLTYGASSGGYSTRDLFTALERMELAGAFFFPIPGPKLIWQFGELGYDYSIDLGCRTCNKPIRWDYASEGRRLRLYQVWSALIRLKKNEPAFRSADFSLYVFQAVKRIEINHADMDVRVIGNFDLVEQSTNPSFSRTGWWYDYFGRDSLQVEDVNALISLQPGEYRIYTTKRLSDPGITAAIREIERKDHGFRVYPNPVSDLLFMEPGPEDAWIRIFDVNGRLVRASVLPAGHTGLDLEDLPAGMYLISRTSSGNTPQRSRFIKTGN